MKNFKIFFNKTLVINKLNNLQIANYLKIFDYKYLLVLLVAVIGVYIGYKNYEKSKAPETGLLKFTISKCTFFLPSNVKEIPQVQFEIYFVNAFKYSVSVRPENGSCKYKKNGQLLQFYTNSNKMLYLNAGETKILTYLSDFDIDVDYTEINKDIYNNFVYNTLYDFKMELSCSTGQYITIPVSIDDSTTSWVPLLDTINIKNNNRIQSMIVMCPPGRWGKVVKIVDNNFKKIEWLEEQ